MKGEFSLRQATLQDTEEIYNLMQVVYNGLSNKSIYICCSQEDVKAMLTEKGFGVVTLNNKGEMIGCFLCEYPGDSEENLGRDIRLPEKVLASVVHAETAVVLPEYRGNALQSRMLQFGENLIDKTKYHYLLATVSPDNPASFKTLERNGFRHIVTKEKYGGVFRRIYRKVL